MDFREHVRFNAASTTFHSFDELRQNLIGWDTDPVQLGTGTLTTRFDQLQFGNTVLYRLRNSKALTDRSGHRHGELAYVICFTWKKWCGFELPPGTIVIKGPVREHRSVMGDDWESLTIHVTDDVADELGLPILSTNYMQTPIEQCVRALPDFLVAEFKSLTRVLMVPFDQEYSASNGREWAQSTCDRALQLLLRAYQLPPEAGVTPTVTSGITGYDLIVSALGYFERSEASKISVAELSDAAGVTARSLNNAFRRYLGVSPNQYILARRLNSAREVLLSNAHSTDLIDVTTVALSQDFYHLSRFAQHYRRLFGELPSETLCRTRSAGLA